ncbi:hypothetical protein CHS0354_007819 [Potamilus streckersoni]|uniref:Uncharacterized protein n=1 Tax=Potamilus streckersoni TaxID=2493646 RepID=A0AAE0RQY0_9BIVA|nr:hypothetical protein CHS0354_007819 [Potamilus streckersoni]
MKKSVFTFAVVLLVYVQSALTRPAAVWLREVTTKFPIDKRTPRNLDLPDQLTFHLRRGSDDFALNLERNYDINPNTDMYFAQKDMDGQLRLVRTRSLIPENVAYYQDRENWAFMTVRCIKRSHATCERVIEGNIQIGDNSYNLRPAKGEITSENLWKVPDSLGKRYVLEDIANIRKENSVETKDAENFKEKELGEESITRLRPGYGKSAILSSGDMATLVNREATFDNNYIDRNRGEGT